MSNACEIWIFQDLLIIHVVNNEWRGCGAKKGLENMNKKRRSRQRNLDCHFPCVSQELVWLGIRRQNNLDHPFAIVTYHHVRFYQWQSNLWSAINNYYGLKLQNQSNCWQ